jgi:hypothetical protein
MDDKSALKVGITSIILIVLIAVLLIWKSGIFIRATGYELVGKFENINGLLTGAEVRYRGFKVGTVASVDPKPGDIRVYFWVKANIEVPEGSYLRVVFDGLIGEKYLDIRPDPKGKVILKPGSVLEGYATSSLADFVDVGTRNLEDTKAILESMRDVFTSQDVMNSLKSVVISTDKITYSINTLLQEMNKLASSGEINRIVTSLREVTDSLSTMTNQIQENILTEDTGNNINEIIYNLKIFTERLNDILPGAENDGAVSTRNASSPGKIIQDLRALKVKPQFELRYSTLNKLANYDALVDFKFRSSFIRAGIGDRLGTTQLLNIQQGFILSKSFTTRVGLINTEPGLGLDLKPFEKLCLSLEAYNLNNMQLDILSRYNVMKYFDLLFDLRKDAASNSYSNFLFGVSYHP